MNHSETFDALTIEALPDSSLTLTKQDSTGFGDTAIRLHRAQARRVGELAGLRDTDQAERELSRLRRHLKTIDWHTQILFKWLDSDEDPDGERFPEFVMARALAAMTRTAVADLPAAHTGIAKP
jgi:hypothetical protein